MLKFDRFCNKYVPHEPQKLQYSLISFFLILGHKCVNDFANLAVHELTRVSQKCIG